jgi:6-phosphogluconolactonase (cycloisomerase 2 family)
MHRVGRAGRFRITCVILALSATVLAGAPGAGAAGTSPRVWVERYNGPGFGIDESTDMAVSPNGSMVFVTGRSDTGPTDDYQTIAYDATTGASRWNVRYGTLGEDQASAIAVSPDASLVFVTGRSADTRGDGATIAYDASTGAQVWLSRFNPSGRENEHPLAIAVSPDGSKVFITGYDVGRFDDTHFSTVAYSAATGAQLWYTDYFPRYDVFPVGIPEALAVSPDGSTLFVTGAGSERDDSVDAVTIAYDTSTGARSWISRYGRQGSSGGRDVVVSPDGTRVLVTGTSTTGGGPVGQYVTLAYDASSGARLWARRYRGPRHSRQDAARAIAIDPGGSTVFVTGQSLTGYATFAYDAATGATRWHVHTHFHGGANDLAVSPDGTTVYVTGSLQSGAGPNPQLVTIAYAASDGTERWEDAYGLAAGTTFGSAVAVSPDGTRVFADGSGQGVGTGYDYVTIGYLAGI